MASQVVNWKLVERGLSRDVTSPERANIEEHSVGR